MKTQKREKISRKIMLGIISFAFIIFISTSTFIGIFYYDAETNKYSEKASAYAIAAADYVDADRIWEYRNPVINEDGEPEYLTDDYYFLVLNFLNSAFINEEALKYYYIIIPYERYVVYLWDATSSEKTVAIGTTEGYIRCSKYRIEALVNDDENDIKQIFSDILYVEGDGPLACAYCPIYDNEGDIVAVAGADLSVNTIYSMLNRLFFIIILSIVVVTTIGTLIFYFVINNRLIKPINHLNNATKDFVNNYEKKEKVNLNINTNDELEELAESFNKMNDDLDTYIDKLSAVTTEKERIGAELKIANQIQADMLPSNFPAFPDRDDFDIYAHMRPAKEVGGDFYDFFLIDENHLCLVIADVSGKGVPAALFMVVSKTLIKNRAKLGESPKEILSNVNNQLCEENSSELFVTVWLAIIDLRTGKGLAANAGHEHPILRKKGETCEYVEYKHSPMLGLLKGLEINEHEFMLNPGDTLFVYTDGVTEATNSDLVLFGKKRTLDSLNKDLSASPKQMVDMVRDDIDDFVGEAPQFDDITMLCFNYIGKSGLKMKELTIEARRNNLDKVLFFVDEQLEKYDCSMKHQMQIDVAVEELFVNIASYAYAPNVGDATIQFDFNEEDRCVSITFIDQGVYYNPLAKADPDVTLSAEKRQIGGLGIYMVKKSMDDVIYNYEDNKNILTIKKKI